MQTTYIESKDGGLFCTKAGTAEIIIKSDEDGAPIVLLVSTEAVDADGDVIHQRRSKHGPGWDTKRFNGAPVITWQHDLRMPNMSGPRTRAKVAKHATKGQGLFLNPLQFDEGDPFAMTIEGKIRRDVIKESSVGFKITDREPRKNEEGQTVGLDIYGAELFEVAIANRGANPETEVLAKSLLTRRDVLQAVETGGDSEVIELRSELIELRSEYDNLGERFDQLVGSVKTMSDKIEVADDAAILQVEEQRNEHKAAIHTAARELLVAMKATGTAHG